METEIIKNSLTYSEAICKIYGYVNGKTREKFYEFVTENNIDIIHLRARKSKYEIVTRECPVCNKKFRTKINCKEERKTCSYSCSNTYFRSGLSNPNWKQDSYRTTCFLYHKKECIICSETKIVSVHHFDENHENNLPENLIPLCPTHHQYVHSRYKDDVMAKIIEYRNKYIKK
jgi:hypothetical protein